MPYAASRVAGKYPSLAELLAPDDASPPARDGLDAVITMAAHRVVLPSKTA